MAVEWKKKLLPSSEVSENEVRLMRTTVPSGRTYKINYMFRFRKSLFI